VTEFLPPDEMTLERAAETLKSEFVVDDDNRRETDRTFYDTFDGLLHAERLELVHEDGRLVLVETWSGRERAGVVTPAPTQALPATQLPPGPLQEALEGVCGVRALLPLVRVRSRLRALRVLDDERKTVVRMTLEEPALISGKNRPRRLRPRVKLVAVRGYDQELEQVQRRLEREHGFKVAEQPLVDEALRAAGGEPGGIPSKINVALGYDQRADDAAARVLHRLLEVIAANVDGTVADVDTEFLHDFRVSIRRTRAVQRELKTVFPRAELDRFRGEFRWLQRATGDARDLDVYVLEFEQYRAMVPDPIRSDLDPLLAVLRDRRAAAHRESARVLRADRATGLLSDWGAFLDRLVGLRGDDRADAARPIGAVAGERVSKVYRQMTKMGGAIDESSPAEEYHELRKKGKELRYLLELFAAPIYPDEVVKQMIRALKALQDVLGRHQDREVQVAMLRSLRDQVAARPDGTAAVMAMGVLVEDLGQDERAARGDFAERFAAFASKAQRKLVKETFG
jgi:CHAD domain-containing protein